MKLRIKPYLVIEAAMIVFSVLLALFLTEWISTIKQEREARKVLGLVHNELELNLEALEEWSVRHKKIEQRIREVVANDSLRKLAFTENGIRTEVLFGTQVYQSLPSSSSWDMASKGNYVSHWPVTTLFAISELYKIQETGVMETMNRMIEVLFSPGLVDETKARINTRFFQGQFEQIYNQEIYLIRRYKETIALVEKELDL
ncbi:MAG: hypothetical protein ACEPOZ_21690 [Marinifilaceae bacterium]